MNANAKATLDLTSKLHLSAERVKRFHNNPHVLDGDSIASHLSRICRLAAYILPTLLDEFKEHAEEKNLREGLLLMCLFHDDDEIIAGKDEITFTKQHNVHDDHEIAAFKQAHQELGTLTADILSNYFEQFRHKSTLTAKIAKVLDNLVGNQVAIEHKIGMVNPDYALICIEYVEKVKGVSQTTDALIDQQIEEIRQLRRELQQSSELLSHLAYTLKERGYGHHDDIFNNMTKLLRVDIDQYELNPDNVYIPVWEYDIDSPLSLEE
jgi:5'-deoxynucleotidase YfbR-like HD superfamily hydrolase